MSRLRRRPDLTPLPIPRPDPQRAVPLPLPPTASAQCSASSSSSSLACSAPSSSSSLHPSQQFSPNPSDFDRIRRIGSGNGGTVYMVVHRPTTKVYALKVIYGNHEESVRRQILREIHILGTANNPYVVHCHGTFVQGGEIQILLEYMDRGSLDSRKPIAEPVLSNIAFQVLMGLAYLHKLKIVHRDIKPSNLLINDRNQVKIADFGVSRILAQTMDPCNSSVGTIAYMSPERINTDLNHGAYDGYAGDIWSLGVTMLECYLGRFPFSIGKQGDWASLVVAICYSQPPEAPPGASNDFRDFIGRCLQREPLKRLTAAQLLMHPFVRQSALASAGGQVLQQPHSSAHGAGGQVLQQPYSSAHGAGGQVLQQPHSSAHG